MAIMTKHSGRDDSDIGDNPLVEKPSRPKPIRDASASSLPAASAPSSGGGGGAGRRAQMMRSMRNLNRAAGASSDPRQEQPRRSSTGDARKAFGGALIGQDRQRDKEASINTSGSSSMPNLYQENSGAGRAPANTNTGTFNSVQRDIRPASSRLDDTSARSLQSPASSSSRRNVIVQQLHRSESGRHVVDSPPNTATDQHSMFEEASRRRAERAAARRRSQEGQAVMMDNDLQAQLAQANGGGGGSESRRMGSRISSMSSASDLSSPVGGAGSRRRSGDQRGDHIRRSMDLSHVAHAASGSGRKGSMSHGLRPPCSTRSLNTSASAMSAVSNASSTLISEQPVVEEEFSRLRLQMSSQQQSQSQAPPSAVAAAVASSCTMDDDERLARELQEQYDRESRATHEGGHGLDMTELYDGTRLMVVNRNSMGHGSGTVGGGGGASGSGSDRRVLCAGCNGRFRVSSGCELLMCPKCDTLTPV